MQEDKRDGEVGRFVLECSRGVVDGRGRHAVLAADGAASRALQKRSPLRLIGAGAPSSLELDEFAPAAWPRPPGACAAASSRGGDGLGHRWRSVQTRCCVAGRERRRPRARLCLVFRFAHFMGLLAYGPPFGRASP